jgi:hypothetical protein
MLFIAWLILRPWRWMRHAPPKSRLTFNGLYGVIYRNTEIYNHCYKNLKSWRATRLILFQQPLRYSAEVLIHLFIHQMLYGPLLGPGLFFSSVIFFTWTTGLLGRVISLSQERYLHIGQHKHRINDHTQTSMFWVRFEPMIPAFEQTKIHALDRAATVIGVIIQAALIKYLRNVKGCIRADHLINVDTRNELGMLPFIWKHYRI